MAEKKVAKKTKEKKDVQTVKKDNPNAKWYVLNIRNGYENKIQKEIKQRAEATGMEDKITDMLVPVQKKIFVKKGKQEIKEEKIFPGYILIKMELDNKTWDLVQNTDGVRGFVKTDRYPKPLAESEVKAITKFMEVEQPSFQTSFSIGEAVKITEGAFADFIGSVQEIDTAKGKIKVLISFLGREAPVDLELSQVTKL
ncbi:TPA: transcription termination/antitermination factor NusG [Candidatus Dojkabacteria bacterium]|uniref:Transcription termination/antitermination protein NusG n=1 Tax=Candidatus Dojkabacteria bacterium TaxID=2099670 RepID=A0A832QDE1_9BACT|nr:transcription termination/antitermination factor NusG [Candidatus Dojkabacteria bacterium]